MEAYETKAYQIFLAELDKQISDAESVFSRPSPLTSADKDTMRIHFHRIKGGGGFFGFHHLASIAARAEYLLLSCDPLTKEAMEEIRKIVSELSDLAPTLRKVPLTK